MQDDLCDLAQLLGCHIAETCRDFVREAKVEAAGGGDLSNHKVKLYAEERLGGCGSVVVRGPSRWRRGRRSS